MPFVREVEGQWRPCATVDLRQLPERRTLTTTFEVLDEFGYTGRPPDGRDARGPVWSPAAVEHVVPAGFVTDLASVPALLWGVIASYGRQTLPAVLHDVLYDAARRAGTMRTGRRLRREADVLFRATLRENGAGPVRQWLMWAAVRTFGSPLVVVPLIALAVALLVLGAVAWAGWYAVVPVAGAAAMVAGGDARGGRHDERGGGRPWQERLPSARVPQSRAGVRGRAGGDAPGGGRHGRDGGRPGGRGGGGAARCRGLR